MFRSSIRKFRSHTSLRTFSTESYENVDAMSIDKAVDMSSPALVSYLHQYGRNEHPAVTQLRKTSIAALPISKARNILEPTTNAMVTWFARAFKATRTIEIGTFTGITSLSLAFAVKENALASNLPLHNFTHTTDSTLTRPITNSFPNVTVDDLCTNLEAPLALTLDSVLHTVTDIAKPAWEEAGVLGNPLVFLHGQGEDVIRVLTDSPLAGTFDMVFVDANKQGYYNYYEAAVWSALIMFFGVAPLQILTVWSLIPMIVKRQRSTNGSRHCMRSMFEFIWINVCIACCYLSVMAY